MKNVITMDAFQELNEMQMRETAGGCGVAATGILPGLQLAKQAVQTINGSGTSKPYNSSGWAEDALHDLMGCKNATECRVNPDAGCPYGK